MIYLKALVPKVAAGYRALLNSYTPSSNGSVIAPQRRFRYERDDLERVAAAQHHWQHHRRPRRDVQPLDARRAVVLLRDGTFV